MPAGIAVFDCALLIGRLAQEVAYFKSLDWSFKAPEVTYLNSFIGRLRHKKLHIKSFDWSKSYIFDWSVN